jgi:hypothetical protein
MKTLADIFDEAADLIEPEGAWTQGYYAMASEDVIRNPVDDDACRFCVVGAIWRAAGDFERRDVVIESIAGDEGDLIRWNDDPRRTQPEVVAKLREAAAKAREQGL